jgi:2,3-bisphosphoglycerate-dependent phosphoglycerate mutase
VCVALEICFETHATSLDNEAGLASGWHDVELSPLGEEQARELGERRRAEPLLAVYCSDLRRSFETAEIAFHGRAFPIARDARLRECDYGTLTRRPVEEIDAWRDRCVRQPFPGGESYEQVAARAGAWLSAVRAAHRSGRILVIGHRATFYAFEHLLRAVPLHHAVASPWKWQEGWEYSTAG